MILYYENRILRKEIAIEEIIAGHQCKESAPPPTPAAAEPDVIPMTRQMADGPSVPYMLQSVLPEMNGSTFWYPELQRKMIEKYPDGAGKIRRGVHMACKWFLRKGIIVKVPGGMIVKQLNAPDQRPGEKPKP